MGKIFIGKVISVLDDLDGERIQVRLYPSDKDISDSNVPWAFPLMPKMLHIKPKVGEGAIVICQNDNTSEQRFYIGPVISQAQNLYEEDVLTSTALLNNHAVNASNALSNNKNAIGVLPKDDDIAICGRKNSDVILSDNDIRIRCGVKLVDEQDTTNISFNNGAPAYIKLKYYPTPLSNVEKKHYENELEKYLDNSADNIVNEDIHADTCSTATIVADKINLISQSGDPYISTNDKDEGINDEEMKKILEKAHQLPYGDVLVECLSAFIKMFYSHTHKYHGLPPCPNTDSINFDTIYGLSEKELKDKLLSKDIRIN